MVSEGDVLLSVRETVRERLCTFVAKAPRCVKNSKSSEHFDHKTVGEIVETLAKRHGYQAKVSPEFTHKTLPYMIRTDQSAVDFLTRLADRMPAEQALLARIKLYKCVQERIDVCSFL